MKEEIEIWFPTDTRDFIKSFNKIGESGDSPRVCRKIKSLVLEEENFIINLEQEEGEEEKVSISMTLKDFESMVNKIPKELIEKHKENWRTVNIE